MILGLGIDLVENDRIARIYQRYGDQFLNRVYSAAEIAYCVPKKNPVPCLAARFAVKEAAIKALGKSNRSPVHLHEISLEGDGPGIKELFFYGDALSIANGLGVRKINVSLSHTATMSTAVVVLEDSW